jgi:Domain of unknown function (DUF4129)
VSARGAAAVVAAALLLLPAGARAADGVSNGELRTLAARAAHDPAALDQLRAVRAVDGRPADLRAALAGARGADLRERLALLAAGARGAAVDPARARAQARDVLAGGDFTPRQPPRPFKSLFDRLGDLVDDLLGGFDIALPGGLGVATIVLAAIVLLVSGAIAARGVRRRARMVAVQAGSARPAGDDPVALERAAARAEANGDHERAVRLRFRAGLLRLGAARVVTYRPSLTSGEVARQLHSPAFERLAADLDEIAYGGRAAGPDDAAAASDGWPRVLEEARRG